MTIDQPWHYIHGGVGYQEDELEIHIEDKKTVCGLTMQGIAWSTSPDCIQCEKCLAWMRENLND